MTTYFNLHISSIIFFVFYLYLKEYHCEKDVFNIAMDSVVTLEKPPGDQSCDERLGKDASKPNSSLFGFSISIDESQNSLWIGAPNCDQVYQCPTFGNCKGMRQSFTDIDLGNRSWFGASVLARDGKAIVCAPRQPKDNSKSSQYHAITDSTGACYFEKHRFSLQNQISYPDYPYNKLGTNSKFLDKFSDVINTFDVSIGKGYENVMEHSGGLLGNNMIFGMKDSVVVGLPYAWMGSHEEVFRQDKMKQERFIGTIGKISLLSLPSKDVIVPQPQAHNEIVKEGGAVWGGTFKEPSQPNEFGTCQYSTKSNPVKNFYTGTSITKGNFFSVRGSADAVDYAVGSPNGNAKDNKLGGLVYLCPNCFKEKKKKDFKELPSDYELILHGLQFGERFGHAIIAIDLNGDKYDDLVIGAPLHATRTHNYKKLEIGTFYVFKNQHSNEPIDQLAIGGKVFELIAVPKHTNDGSLTEIVNLGVKILKRKEATSGSRFGMSLINLGRFDGDEYEDFAVGAPGEDDGVGAIYVYRGSQSFWTKDNDKNDDEIKLTPKSLKMAKPTKGLGYSFSSNAQKLNNGLDTKFAVGAVSTDDDLNTPVVVTLESRPTIQIVPSSQKTDDINVANGDVVHLEFKAKAKTITNIEQNRNENLNLIVSVQQTKDQLIDFSQTKLEWKYEIPSSQDNEFEKTIKDIDIKINKTNKIADPAKIAFKLSWSTPLIPCSGGNEKTCPMKDPRSDWEESLEHNFWIGAGCADPKKCKCNITLSPTNNNLVYTLGKDNTLTVPFTLSNTGIEPSIGSRIDFRFSGVNFELVEDPKYSCKKEVKTSSGNAIILETESVQPNDIFKYDCGLNGKLDNGTTTDMSIKLKLPNKLYSNDTFSTKLYFNSICDRKNNDHFQINYTLKSVFTIKAASNVRDQENKTMGDSKIEHRYKIWNSGPSITNKDYSFIIGIPKAHAPKDKLVFPNVNINCERNGAIGTDECLNDVKEVTSDELNFVHYVCHLEKGMMPMMEKELPLKINFKTSSIQKKNGTVPDKYVLPSFIKLPDSNGCITQSTIFLTSFIGNVEAKSPIWPIIVGVCVGIIVVAASIFLMWKYEVFSKLRIKYPDQFEDVVELGKLNQ